MKTDKTNALNQNLKNTKKRGGGCRALIEFFPDLQNIKKLKNFKISKIVSKCFMYTWLDKCCSLVSVSVERMPGSSKSINVSASYKSKSKKIL